MNKYTQLTKLQLTLFALPNVSMAAFLLPVVVYLPPFYAGHLDIGLATVGGVFFTAKLFDIATDPLFGILSDRTQTRWGRRRHWLVIALPMMMLCTYKLFIPSGSVTESYLLLWLIITYVGWTAMLLSHVTWGSELSSQYHERSRIQGYLKAAGILGNLGVLAIPALIEISGGGKESVVNGMGIFVLVAMPIGVLAAVTMVPENPSVRVDRTGLRQAIASIVENVPLRLLLLATFCKTLATASSAGLYVFYTQKVLGLADKTGVLLLIYFSAAFLFIPLWVRLSSRIGKHRTFACSSVFGACSVVFMATLPPESLILTALAFGLVGANFSVLDILPRSIMSDVIDRDAVNTKSERSGVYFSMQLTVTKLSAAIAVGATYLLLGSIGFDANGANTADILVNFRWVFAGFPLFAYLLIIPIMIYFPLDEKRQAALRQRIEKDTSLV